MNKFLLVNDTIKSKNLGCQLVSHCLRESFDKSFDSVYIVGKIDKVKHYRVKDYQYIYVNGEGSMAGKVEQTIYKYCKQAIKDKIPLYLNNLTFDPLGNKQFFNSWENVLKKAKSVCVREPLSYYYLQNKGIDNVKIFPDIGVTYEGKLPEKENIICFGGGSINKRHTINQDNINAFRKIFEAFKDYKLMFLDWPSSVYDYSYLSKALTESIEVVRPTFMEYWQIVARAKLNVTGRHHGCVMSYSAETPFITFSANMWKTPGDCLLYRDTLDNYFQNMPNGKNVDLIIKRMQYELDNNNLEIEKIKQKKKHLLPFNEGQVLERDCCSIVIP